MPLHPKSDGPAFKTLGVCLDLAKDHAEMRKILERYWSRMLNLPNIGRPPDWSYNVNILRSEANCSLRDAIEALSRANNDLDKAYALLREWRAVR